MTRRRMIAGLSVAAYRLSRGSSANSSPTRLGLQLNRCTLTTEALRTRRLDFIKN